MGRSPAACMRVPPMPKASSSGRRARMPSSSAPPWVSPDSSPATIISFMSTRPREEPISVWGSLTGGAYGWQCANGTLMKPAPPTHFQFRRVEYTAPTCPAAISGLLDGSPRLALRPRYARQRLPWTRQRLARARDRRMKLWRRCGSTGFRLTESFHAPALLADPGGQDILVLHGKIVAGNGDDMLQFGYQVGVEVAAPVGHAFEPRVIDNAAYPQLFLELKNLGEPVR